MDRSKTCILSVRWCAVPTDVPASAKPSSFIEWSVQKSEGSRSDAVIYGELTLFCCTPIEIYRLKCVLIGLILVLPTFIFLLFYLVSSSSVSRFNNSFSITFEQLFVVREDNVMYLWTFPY